MEDDHQHDDSGWGERGAQRPAHPTHGPHRQTQKHPSPESVRDERIGYSCGVNGSLLSSPVLTTCSRLLESEEEPVGRATGSREAETGWGERGAERPAHPTHSHPVSAARVGEPVLGGVSGSLRSPLLPPARHPTHSHPVSACSSRGAGSRCPAPPPQSHQIGICPPD